MAPAQSGGRARDNGVSACGQHGYRRTGWQGREQALADIRAGRVADGRAAPADALRLAGSSLDRSAVAVVVDGIAAAALWADGSRASAERAAVLLGAAHSIRGAFDHSSLDAPQAGDTARRTLGGQAFEQAYRRGRELGYDEALGLAEETTRTSPER
jgi:hypothetical protein